MQCFTPYWHAGASVKASNKPGTHCPAAAQTLECHSAVFSMAVGQQWTQPRRQLLTQPSLLHVLHARVDTCRPTFIACTAAEHTMSHNIRWQSGGGLHTPARCGGYTHDNMLYCARQSGIRKARLLPASLGLSQRQSELNNTGVLLRQPLSSHTTPRN